MILSQPRARVVKQLGIPQLLALSEGMNIPLDKPIVLIGRHQECDIQIPSRKISRRHCCIAQVADHLVVRDLGSTNGIRINGIKVIEGNLQPNDELTIGNMLYQVKWGGAAEPSLPPKNGIKAGKPNLKYNAGTDESFEDPMPLPDVALAHPILQAKPNAAPAPKANEPNKAQAGAAANGRSLEIPDNVNLKPLDPPAK